MQLQSFVAGNANAGSGEAASWLRNSVVCNLGHDTLKAYRCIYLSRLSFINRMTVVEGIGCVLISFGVPIALFVTTIMNDSLKIIIMAFR